MTDRKISELNNITGADLADNDEFVVVDTSADETKAITYGELKNFNGTLDVTGNVIASGTVEPAGDTAAGDNAAVGYTSAEGLILTGQGSTSDITFKNDADATVFSIPTGTDDILFPDNAKIFMGASSDLSLYHDGSNSYLQDLGTGYLVISGNGPGVRINSDTAEVMADFTPNGAATLYHNNAAKLATTATGVDVTGIIVSDGMSTNTSGTSNFIAGVNAGNSIQSGGNYNVAVGDEAGTAITTATENTFIGQRAGENYTTGDINTAVGSYALNAIGGTGTGTVNAAFGKNALLNNTSGSQNTALGTYTLSANTTASYNTAAGYGAGIAVTTGIQNTFLGGLAGDGTDDGSNNTAVGYLALSANAGNDNTAIGVEALILTTAANSTAVGQKAGSALTSGSNCLFLGQNAGLTGHPGGNFTTQSNAVVVGNVSTSAAHVQVDWTVASDQRDKTDFTALDLGLDFVKALAPVTYKWDKRAKYGDSTADDYDLSAQTPDGTHKEDWLDIGFKAQEVQALEEAAGYTTASKKNLTVSTSDDGKQMGLQYSKFVPILVKALQELSAKNDALEARITALEGN